MRYVREYATYQRLQGEELLKKQEQVNRKKQELRQVKSAKKELLKEREAEKAKLEEQEKEKKTRRGRRNKKEKEEEKEEKKKGFGLGSLMKGLGSKGPSTFPPTEVSAREGDEV